MEQKDTYKNCTKPISHTNNEINMVLENWNEDKGAKYLKYVELDNKKCIALIIISMKLRGFGEDNIVRSRGNIVHSILKGDEVVAEKIKFKLVPDDIQPVDIIARRNFTELDSHIF